MSDLGNAVHLLPPSEVRKAPMGKFGLVDMAKRECRQEDRVWAIPAASRDYGSRSMLVSVAYRRKPPLKGARQQGKEKMMASRAVTLESNASRNWRRRAGKGREEGASDSKKQIDGRGGPSNGFVERDGVGNEWPRRKVFEVEGRQEKGTGKRRVGSRHQHQHQSE